MSKITVLRKRNNKKGYALRFEINSDYATKVLEMLVSKEVVK